MTTTQVPPCPSCGSVACNVQSDNFCRHTREVRPAFTQTDEGEAAFDNRVDAERNTVSALVLENQNAKPLRDEKGNAYCRHEVDGVQCTLLMGHDDERTKGDDATDHAFPEAVAFLRGPEDEDDRDEDEKDDDDDDGDTSEDGHLRDVKGVEDAPNKQVTRQKKGVTTK